MIRILSLAVSFSLLLGSFSFCLAGNSCGVTCCEKMQSLITQRLELTDEERKDVFEILRNARSERRALVKQLRAPDMTQEKRLAIHSKIQEVDVASRAELASMFSEEQMEKFDEIMVELREKILSCLR